MEVARVRVVLAVVACSFAFAQSSIAQQANAPSRQFNEDPYAGVVLNQTITVIGQDFYRYFVTSWRDRDMSDRYAISIHERPTARLGSQVWIEFGQRRVFETILPPARSQIRALSEQAVEATREAIVNADVQRMLFRDQDMAPDEI